MSGNERLGGVLLIVENLPVPRDRRVWQEALALRDAGWQVSVICPRRPACPEPYVVVDGIHIFRHWLPEDAVGVAGYLAEYSIALFWQFVLAWRVLLSRGFDVIEACNPPETIFLVGLLFKLLLGKRFVFDHHDLSPELFEAKFKRRGPLHRLLLLLERWTFKSADISLATNDTFRQVAIKRGGMDPDRVFVVRSGPDLDRLRVGPAVPELRRGRRHLVGYMGVMNSQDGVDYLIRAAHHLLRVGTPRDVQFVLIGDGPDRPALERLAATLGITDRLLFTGWLDGDEQLPWLNSCDVCVCPDPSNGFNDKCTMNKVLEYMALGKPVVQFDLPEGRVSAGEAALYARPNDPADLAEKIGTLLDDQALCRRLGAIGRQRIEGELSWQRQAPRLVAAYETLIATVPRRRADQRASS